MSADTSTQSAEARGSASARREASWRAGRVMRLWTGGTLLLRWKLTSSSAAWAPGPRLDNMSLLKQRGRELERFDGLSLIYWYVTGEHVRVQAARGVPLWERGNAMKLLYKLWKWYVALNTTEFLINSTHVVYIKSDAFCWMKFGSLVKCLLCTVRWSN